MGPSLQLGAGLAAGLAIGIERGWRLRREKAGARVAGVRTFALLGLGGAIAGLIGDLVHPLAAVVMAGSLAALLIVAFAHDRSRRDATSAVAALVALGLGILAGAGQPALAIAGAAVVTLILATRNQLHRFVERLNATDVQAFARYAVIAAAVLPFLPNRQVGPLLAWNPFQLWLVVVLITGFSFVGYIANRTIGERKGVLATSLIGGAYSSTAVTQSLALRLGGGEEGPLTAGILIASAVMYVRILLLVGILSPSTFLAFLMMMAPAGLAAIVIAMFAWVGAPKGASTKGEAFQNPIELVPALGFVAIVAVGAVATRWAEQHWGEGGTASSLFITGTFDVDAAIVTLSGLPPRAIDRELAATALAGTVVANMSLKMLVAGLYARRRSGPSLIGLGASTIVLASTIAIAVTLRAGAF